MNKEKVVIGFAVGVLLIASIIIALVLNNRIVPNEPKQPETINVSFGELVLNMNQTANVENYLKIKLVSSSDSRCPKNVNCIWQGEINYKLDIDGEIVELGTVKQKDTSAKGCLIELYGTNESTDKVRLRVLGIEE